MPLIDPDEGRNAEVAREMAARRDYVVPALADMPYLDKPPALFWMTALTIGALGRSAWTARLPSAIAAAVTVALVCVLAMRLSGPPLARRVALLLLAAPLFLGLAGYVIFDMPLAACVTVLWTALAHEASRGPGRAARIAMYAAVGLGLLLKGPVILAWALGGSLGAALLLRSRVPLRWVASLRGWALALVLAGGWFALACARHPEYPHYAFLEETFERFGTSGFHREQPAWFALAVLVGGTLPWSLSTPWSLRLTPAARVAAGFVLFAAIFFTFSHSKLVTYLLPAVPALAWIAAEAWSDAPRARRGTWVLAGLSLAAAAACVVAARLPGIARSLPIAVPAVLGTVALGLALVALLAAAAAWRRSTSGYALHLAFVAALVGLGHPIIAAYARTQSGQPLADAIRAAQPGARVRYEYCYSPGTDFSLGRTSLLVSPSGRETTSNYQARYRRTLIARGQWTALATVPARSSDVVVRSARDPRPDPPGMTCFFRDARFTAWRAAAVR